MNGTYFRWTEGAAGCCVADILSSDLSIVADRESGKVTALIPDRPLSPDEARMIGVRLIEGAALADGDRAVRKSA